MEALRNIEYLKSEGAIVMNSRVIHPVIETNELVVNRRESLPYVMLDDILVQLEKATKQVLVVDAAALATEAGNPRTENVVLLGAASRLEGFSLKRARDDAESFETINFQCAIESMRKLLKLKRETS